MDSICSSIEVTIAGTCLDARRAPAERTFGSIERIGASRKTLGCAPAGVNADVEVVRQRGREIVEQEQAACRRTFAARALGAHIAGGLIPARVSAAGANGHVGKFE
jgi:hypothetical protein